MFIYLLKIILWINLIFIGLGVVEALTRLIVALWKLYKTKFPFAKRFHPLFGHLKVIQSGECPFVFSQLGNNSKTHCALRGTHPCIVTSDPVLITKICTKYADHFHSRMIEPLAPDSFHSPHVHVFGARGQRWKRIRTITSLALSTAQLRKMLPIINEQADDFIDYLGNLLPKSKMNYSTIETDMHLLFQKLTAGVIGRIIFALEKNTYETPLEHFSIFKKIFGDEPKTGLDAETFQWISPLLTKLYKHIQASWGSSRSPVDDLNDYIKTILGRIEKGHDKVAILQKFKNVENPDTCFTSEPDYGVLNLKNTPKADSMLSEEIIAQSRFLSIAGFDTTANTLALACFLLAEYPEKLQKLRNEIDNISDDFNYEDLAEATYLNAVILETLRLFPHASMLQSRLSMADCTLDDGRVIPAGVGILFDTWGLHRDVNYWGPDADEFVPERHLSSTSFPEYFNPFGAGLRQCVGKRLALMETKAVLIKVLKEFTVYLPPAVSSQSLYISLRNTGTVWPKDCKIRIQRRQTIPAPA